MWINQQNYKKVGARLSNLRKQAGLSQAELARMIGKPQSFVSSYENGQRRVDILELQVLADAFELEPVKVFQAAVGALEPRKKTLRKVAKPGPR